MPNSWSLKHHVGPSPIQSLGDEAGIGITPRASHMLHFFFFFFKKLKVCSNPTSSKSAGAVCSLPVSLSHGGNTDNSSDFFIVIVFVMLICDQWPLITTVSKRV